MAPMDKSSVPFSCVEFHFPGSAGPDKVLAMTTTNTTRTRENEIQTNDLSLNFYKFLSWDEVSSEEVKSCYSSTFVVQRVSGLRALFGNIWLNTRLMRCSIA